MMHALRAVGLAWIVRLRRWPAHKPQPQVRSRQSDFLGSRIPHLQTRPIPPQLLRAGSLAVVNGRGIPVAAVTRIGCSKPPPGM